MATTDSLPAVALLARAGVARDRLAEALRDAGARLVLEADPAEADDASVAASGARALVIALEPAGDDVLDRYDRSLGDPGMLVLIEEADLVARREGWDAARWSRHVAAKLAGHDRVLPPGGEDDDAPAISAAFDIESISFEQSASGDLRVEDIASDDISFEPFPITDLDEDDGDTAADSGIELGGIVSAEDMDWSSGGEHTLDEIDIAAQFPDFAPATAEAFSIEPAQPGSRAEDDDAEPEFEASPDTDAAYAPASPARAPSELSLVDADAVLSPQASDAATVSNDSPHTLQALHTSASRLSLVDLDDGSATPADAGQGAPRGVVLVEGGMGGPDAVRQILAAIPKAFPRALVIRLKLESGRYDSLVKQMQRASKRTVALAQAGQAIDAGTVYFLPPDVDITQGANARPQFSAADPSAQPYASLAADDTAIVFISGGDPALVEPAMALAGQGALVGAQSADTCYDAAACQAVIAHGGISGTPTELAARLAHRWHD